MDDDRRMLDADTHSDVNGEDDHQENKEVEKKFVGQRFSAEKKAGEAGGCRGKVRGFSRVVSRNILYSRVASFIYSHKIDAHDSRFQVFESSLVEVSVQN